MTKKTFLLLFLSIPFWFLGQSNTCEYLSFPDTCEIVARGSWNMMYGGLYEVTSEEINGNMRQQTIVFKSGEIYIDGYLYFTFIPNEIGDRFNDNLHYRGKQGGVLSQEVNCWFLHNSLNPKKNVNGENIYILNIEFIKKNGVNTPALTYYLKAK